MNFIKKILEKIGIIKELSPIDHALKVVEVTKPEEWTVYSVNKDECQYCFLGHMAKSYGEIPNNTSQVLKIPKVALIDMKIVSYVRQKHNEYIGHSHEINDTTCVNGYKEAHPRDRMLHVLRDMKKDGW